MPTVGANRHPRRKGIHCCSKADLLVLHSFFSLELLALVPVLNSWVEIMSWVGVLQTCSLRPKHLGILPKLLGILPMFLGFFSAWWIPLLKLGRSFNYRPRSTIRV